MTFQESIKVCFEKYADFTGHASRSEYWWFFLFVILVGAAASYVNDATSGIWFIGTLLPSLAAATRRLHDTNRSGWWQLIGLVPVVGWIVMIVFLAQEGTSDRPLDRLPT